MTRPAVIFGGVGFVGTNLAAALASAGRPVRVVDNLSRVGAEDNAAWLKRRFGDGVTIDVADIRDPHAVSEAVADAGQVFHLAAQVAVTTSLRDPIVDFETNARGALNILEALRRLREPPPLVYTSTNKVYGALESLALIELASRYAPADERLATTGIRETTPLCFCSPYACSKGAADQYVLDYARTFGLPAVVLRMSCIYGPMQRGNEDQGWVAHFLMSAALRDTITIFGDGKQVRDVLFVDDLVRALVVAANRAPQLAGQAFNIGGGPRNTLSLLELIDLCRELNGEPPALRYAVWRPGDQRYFVSSIASFRDATGWSPKIDVRSGVKRLQRWLESALLPALRQRRAQERARTMQASPRSSAS